VKKQLLNQNHELFGVLRFDQRLWLTSTVSGPAPFTSGDELTSIILQTSTNPPRDCAVLVTNYLHGLIRAAVSKG
jgi:hypothetical protein